MQVKDLKALLEGADDEMPVFVLVDDTFHPPIAQLSGVSESGPACDAEGNELAEQPETMHFFALIMNEQNEVKPI